MSTAFPSTPTPTAEKLRGGYYTPPSLAAFLAAWVADAGTKLLEPSCGDGAILRFLPSAASVTAIELNQAEAEKASRAVPSATVVEDDFFRWLDPTELGSWDGVAGNPPFIRYQHWTEPTRSMAFDLMRSVSMKPTKLTNAWVPFIVGSSLALHEGGRLALVVPAELLQVSYASELRAFLIDEFAELTVLTFRRLLFDRVLQEVVLLLGVRGSGPAHIRVIECDDADSLPTAKALAAWPQAPALRHETEKWTKYFLPPVEIEALRIVRDGLPRMTRLGALADVDVGVVTGRNQFFVLRPSDTSERDLNAHVLPLVSKSAHVAGVRFDEADLADLEEADALCHLLAIDAELVLGEDAALQTYVDEGEDAEVHLGYKCRIRKQWWSVPSIWRPDAFMLRQIYDHPRVIANDTGATSTDTIHRVRMVNGTPPAALAAASINSVTFAFSEVLGRSYGGGVLELEPREAEALPYPDPDGLSAKDIRKVDALLRAGKLIDALDYVDQRLLVDQAGIDPALIATLRGSWQRLRDRRLARGRKAPPS